MLSSTCYKPKLNIITALGVFYYSKNVLVFDLCAYVQNIQGFVAEFLKPSIFFSAWLRLRTFLFWRKNMLLKFLNFNFFEKLFENLYLLFKNLFEILCLLLMFAFILGIVAVPVLIIYFIIAAIFFRKKENYNFINHMPFIAVLSGIITTIYIIFFL